MLRLTSFFIASEINDYHPRALSWQAFLAYGLILLAARILAGPPAPLVQSAAVDSNTLMRLINAERAGRNLITLNVDGKLLAAAGEKTADMIERDYFAHVDPDGNYVWGRIVEAGYAPYKILGENLAVNFTTSEGMVKAWMNSLKHRENLLHEEFLDQGLAAAYGDYQGRYTSLTTSLFGALADKSVIPATAGIQEPSPPSSPQSPPQPSPRTFNLTRAIFTVAGLLLLVLLAIDTAIIFRHRPAPRRSHSSYHLFSFFMLAVLSIAVWWW